MATWIDPVDSQTDPDAPITSDLAKRWDNNVIALSEGASGAPKIQGHALTGVFVGSLKRHSGTSPIGINDLGNFDALGLSMNARAANTAGHSVQIRFSEDNGSNFGGWLTLVGQNQIVSSYAVLSKKDNYFYVTGQPGSDASKAVAVPSGANAFQVRNSASDAQSYLDIMVFVLGGML